MTEFGLVVAGRQGLFPVDLIYEEIAHLARLASAVLNEHTNDGGLCVACGSAFPCSAAALAEGNLGLV